jgi:TP901-1 family phage major tail protein
MAENGRALTINWKSVTLAGVRTRGHTLSNELVDVTSDDSNGWQTFLATPGIRSVEISVGGITENQALIADFYSGLASGATVINLPTTTGTAAGTFMLESFSETGEHDGAVEFEATFKSSGPVTFTAGVID